MNRDMVPTGGWESTVPQFNAFSEWSPGCCCDGGEIMFKRFRFLLTISLIVLLAGCFAQLTPQLLHEPYREPFESMREFTDRFDNPVRLGNRWQRVAGWWRIDDGMLFQTLRWKSSLPGDYQMIYVDGLSSGPYRVETRLCMINEGEQAAGILFRFQDQNCFCLLRLMHFPRWQDFADVTQFIKGGRREDLGRKDLSVKPGQWYTLRVDDHGDEIIAFLDGNELFRCTAKDKAVGTIGLAAKTGKVAFDYFNASLNDPTEEEKAPPPVAKVSLEGLYVR